MLKLLSNSGASTNIEAIAGASISILERGYNPDVIDGISSGALIAPFLATGRLDDLTRLVLTYNLSSAFNVPPVNKKGKPTIRAAVRAITGKASLGVMDNLYTTLTNSFTKKDFYEWRNKDSSPDIYIGTVEYRTGKLHRTSLRSCSYQTAVKYIIASASIPIMAPPVNIYGNLHYDGGARAHTLAPYMQQNFKGNIERHISIYSRPQDFRIPKPDLTNKLIPLAARTLEIMVTEISKDNEREERAFRINNGLALQDMVFMPHLLKNEVYDFGNNREKFEIGYKEGSKVSI